MLKPGQMRETFTIEQPSGVGPLGQTVWETFETARGSLTAGTGFRGGHELNAPQSSGSEVFYTVSIRYLSGLRSNMRLILQPTGRIFKISHLVQNTEGNARSWDIYCREVLTV